MAILTEGKVIGGHAGLRVSRTEFGIVKEVYSDEGQAGEWLAMNLKGIHNEARFLRILEDTGFVPRLLEEQSDYIVQEDVGECESVKDMQTLRRNCVRLLLAILGRLVRHQDLSFVNVIIRNDFAYAIDFQQSRLYGEEPNPQERYETDSALLWKWLAVLKNPQGIADENRIIRRWISVMASMDNSLCRISRLQGKTFLDLGCFQGDFVAMAAAEGMEAEGVDFGGFRTGEDSIEIARELWKGTPCQFTKANIVDLPASYFERDVVMMFSTWSYIAERYGWVRAKQVLEDIIEHCGVLFFENQLWGDGPGPNALQTDEDVMGLLLSCGASGPEPLITIPVNGRDAQRTVWRASK